MQVRTIFEDAWSEIDHTIRYPYDLNNPIFFQFLLILNRLAGSADEMGSFIKFLQKELQTLKNEKSQLVNDLEEKITALNLQGAQLTSLRSDLEKLKSQRDLGFFALPSSSELKSSWDALINFGEVGKLTSYNFPRTSFYDPSVAFANFKPSSRAEMAPISAFGISGDVDVSKTINKSSPNPTKQKKQTKKQPSKKASQNASTKKPRAARKKEK